MNKYFDSNYALDISKKTITDMDVIDKAAINQSIESILMTDKGERIFEPNFGSFLSDIIFERLNKDFGEQILDELISLILRYEDRITIVSELCSMRVSNSTNSIDLKIVYIINSDQTPGQFNKKIIF